MRNLPFVSERFFWPWFGAAFAWWLVTILSIAAGLGEEKVVGAALFGLFAAGMARASDGEPGRRPTVVGPHVLVPTAETAEHTHNNKPQGRKRIWECKYCDWSGIHPDESEVHVTIKNDCDDVEWLGAELAGFEAENTNE